MKALVQTAVETLEYRDAPDPVPEAGQERIMVEAVGICGSDMHAYLGHDERRPTPLILGHEAAGTIAGGTRRVTINPLVSCGTCEDCRAGRDNLCPSRMIISMPPREGAFAEQVVMRRENLVTIPDGISSEAASLAEPIACGWHAVRLAAAAAAKPLNEATALVFGGGAIGVGAALSLAAQGAARIFVAETNISRAKTLGAIGDFEVFDPTTSDGPGPDGADIVIDGVGIDATRAAASRLVRHGGVIAHIGLGAGAGGLDIRRFTLQEITFFGTYTYTAQDFRDTSAAIFDGRLGPLDWPEIRPLSEGARAFADIRAGKTAAPKIILKP